MANTPAQPTSTGMTILTVLLLLFVTPIGVIVMWAGTSWSKTAKWIVTIIFILGSLLVAFLAIVLFGAMIVAVNPSKQIERAQLQMTQSVAQEIITGAEQFYADEQRYPASIDEMVSAGTLDADVMGRDSDTVYEYTSTAKGTDCELTITMPDKQPVVQLCSMPDLKTVFTLTE
jgi:competence protein ComGC